MAARRKPTESSRDAVSLPTITPWLFNGFYKFCRYYLRKHFHAVAIDRRAFHSAPIDPAAPLICYANHPGWWDPIIAIHLCQSCFAGRRFYAPIDAEALKKYGIFSKLGFYGIETHSLHGAANFLKVSRRILAEPNTSIWITPEGRFADPRDHEATLMPGLAHLALQNEHVVLLPLAIEYVFWEERLPEALMRFGNPMQGIELKGLTKEECSSLLTDRLRETQNALAQSAIARRSEDFEIQLSGKTGTFSFYDWFRSMRGRWSGEKVELQHGSKLNT